MIHEPTVHAAVVRFVRGQDGAARRAGIKKLLAEFGEAKKIPREELRPALVDDLPEKIAEADKEVDDLISDLYPK